MTRKEQIEQAALGVGRCAPLQRMGFIQGAEWADANFDHENVYFKEMQASRDKLEQALAVAKEALEESSLSPYQDSDLRSLMITINNRSKEALAEIEKIMGEK